MSSTAALSVRLDDLEFSLDAVNGTDYVARQIADGTYEHPLPRVFVSAVRRWPGLVLDVGANNGLYSLLACLAEPRSHTLAFEPYPPVIDVLQRNIAVNNLEDRIAHLPIALSSCDRRADLFVPHQNHGLLDTSCSLESDFQPSSAQDQVDVRKLDSLRFSEPPTIIKVDIEGHEHAFLQGGLQTIRAYRPILFVEVLRAARFDVLNAFKLDAGYVDFRLRPDMAIFSEKVSFDLTAWNHALIPEERADEFAALLSELGLEVVRPYLPDRRFRVREILRDTQRALTSRISGSRRSAPNRGTERYQAKEQGH